MEHIVAVSYQLNIAICIPVWRSRAFLIARAMQQCFCLEAFKQLCITPRRHRWIGPMLQQPMYGSAVVEIGVKKDVNNGRAGAVGCLL